MMGHQDLQSWQSDAKDFFHDARAELRQIIAAIDELIVEDLSLTPRAMQDDPSLTPRTTLEEPTLTQEETSLTQEDFSQTVRTTQREEPARTLQATADFSQRLDQLKRQLDERLQDRKTAGDETISETFGGAT